MPGDNMSFLENASIRTKILAVIIPLCLTGLCATAFMAMRFKATDTVYSNFITNDAATSVELAFVKENVVSAVYAAYKIALYMADDPNYTATRTGFNKTKAELNERLKSLPARLPDIADQIQALSAQAKEITDLADDVIGGSGLGFSETQQQILSQADGKTLRFNRDIDALIGTLSQQIRETSTRLQGETDFTIAASLYGLAVIFACGIAAALLVSVKGITGPVNRLRVRMISLAHGETESDVAGTDRADELGEMARAVSVFRDNAIERIRVTAEADATRFRAESERIEREEQKAGEAAATRLAVDTLASALERLSNGDLAHRIETEFSENLDALRTNYNKSVSTLMDALVAVGSNARAIGTGANEIRAAADNLSRRTEQQASSVEETAAALEQMTTTVSDSRQRLEDAKELVARARDAAEESGRVSHDAVCAMREIEKSSSQINMIIGVIDEIAFQTNLLALNAGVEAARAGEAGKGFAVVAQEVRELAQRSATAAREIKGLISSSGQQVRAGVEMVDHAGRVLDLISRQVQGINEHVVAIVEASREQATGLQEINRAVNMIDQGTQQNAAMVQQSTAASHGLAQEVEDLNRLLHRFRFASDNVHELPADLTSVTRNELPSVIPARSMNLRIATAFRR